GHAPTEVLLNLSLPGLYRNAGKRDAMRDGMDAYLGGKWWRDVWASLRHLRSPVGGRWYSRRPAVGGGVPAPVPRSEWISRGDMSPRTLFPAKELTEIRERLEEELQRIHAQRTGITEAVQETADSWGENDQESADVGSSTFEREKELSIS